VVILEPVGRSFGDETRIFLLGTVVRTIAPSAEEGVPGIQRML
jgi:hypothetical protein